MFGFLFMSEFYDFGFLLLSVFFYRSSRDRRVWSKVFYRGPKAVRAMSVVDGVYKVCQSTITGSFRGRSFLGDNNSVFRSC